MATNRVERVPPVAKLFEEAKQLSPDDLKQLTEQLLTLQHNSPEADLLARINYKWSADKQVRFDKLVKKRRAERIAEEELQELIHLTDEAEDLNAQRVQALVELAQLRQITLPGLMRQLGIKPPAII